MDNVQLVLRKGAGLFKFPAARKERREQRVLARLDRRAAVRLRRRPLCVCVFECVCVLLHIYYIETFTMYTYYMICIIYSYTSYHGYDIYIYICIYIYMSHTHMCVYHHIHITYLPRQSQAREAPENAYHTILYSCEGY